MTQEEVAKAMGTIQAVVAHPAHLGTPPPQR